MNGQFCCHEQCGWFGFKDAVSCPKKLQGYWAGVLMKNIKKKRLLLDFKEKSTRMLAVAALIDAVCDRRYHRAFIFPHALRVLGNTSGNSGNPNAGSPNAYDAKN